MEDIKYKLQNGENIRSHISVIFDDFLRIAFSILAFVIYNRITNDSDLEIASDNLLVAILIALAIIVAISSVILIFCFFRWYKTTVYIKDGMLYIQRKTLFSKNRMYNISEISNINLEENIFEKIVGTCKIKIDTNSSATAEKTDVKIVFKKEVALLFKNYIMGKDDVEDRSEDEFYDLRYSSDEVCKHAVFNMNLAPIFFLFFVVLGLLIFKNAVDSSISLKSILLDSVGSGLAFILMIVSTIYMFAKEILKFHGFSALRMDDKIHIKYGLLTTSKKIIPIEKINSVVIKQKILSRLFRRYQVEIVNVGMGDEKNESSLILLSDTKENIQEKLQLILPEYKDILIPNLEKQNKLYFVHKIPLVLVAAILFIGAIVFRNSFPEKVLGYSYLISTGLILVLIILGCILGYFAAGIYISKDCIIVSSGIFTKVYRMINYDKIQKISLNEGIISKFTKQSKVMVFINGKISERIITLPLITNDKFVGISERVIEAV